MKENQKEEERIFKIFDLKKSKIIFETIIRNKVLIGRIESGLYTIADGHIYYSNNVIKIRYDLINSPFVSKYKEEQIFDFYFDIFQIAKTEKIKSTTPL
jgi:hypothetical protein